MKVLLIVAVCAVGVYGRVAPDFFPTCKRTDPEISKCILAGVEAMRPQLRAGIPEVNIPPLEPFTLPTLRLNRNVPNLKLKATVSNTKAYGGSNFTIKGLKVNVVNQYAAEVKLFFPKLTVVTDYDVKGSRILTLDLNGRGRLMGEFTGIKVVGKGVAKPVIKDGKEYLQVEKVITKVKIGNGQISFDKTDRPLAAATAATFFNASPGLVFDVINPLIEETAAAVVKAFANKLLADLPISDILID